MKTLGAKHFVGPAVLACRPAVHLQAQVDLKAAIYGSDTVALGTALSTLGPITVTQISVNNTATYAYNFVTDASRVSNYIYFPTPTGTTNPFVVGGVYTGLQVTSAPFGTSPTWN